MEKMKMHSYSRVDANVKKIEALFPNCVTEVINDDGELERVIDFDALKEEFSTHMVEGKRERYQFTWPDKNKAKALLNQDVTSTLRPCREESVNFDSTENLYIEGDNLEVLKLLQETYLGKIKMIYIDPPYNTGKDFVYKDNFGKTIKEYKDISSDYDDDGNQLFKNLDANGRFHTDWLNMIYPRLIIARDLLKDDGVIFISINDAEICNLKAICNEIFGEKNFIADLIWANKEGGGSSDSRLFRIKHEHILCYSRNIAFCSIIGLPISNVERYTGVDEYESIRGRYYTQKLGMGSIQYSPSLDYPILAPDGSYIMPADNNGGKKACWRWSKEKFEKNKEKGFVIIKKNTAGIWTVYTKQYMNCDNEGNIIDRTQRPMGIIEDFSSTQAAKQMEKLGFGNYFDYTKPVDLLKFLIARVDCKNQIILDFFSGSSSTAQAVMELNSADGGNRRYIMIQLPETQSMKVEAINHGYKSICDIGISRIKKVGTQMSYDIVNTNIDFGFRVLKLDSSNMNDIYYKPSEYSQDMLAQMESNIKSDRTPEDLLFQVMLDLGVELSSKIDSITIKGKEIFNVAEGWVMACFDEDVSEDVIIEVAKYKPRYFVMRDSSMAHDTVSVNFDEIFNRYSPETIRKVM